MNFETLYNDISTNVLPKIADGLTITKDYAYDLFGRYITYLIITDGFFFLVGIIGFILSLKYMKKLYVWSKSDDYNTNYSSDDETKYFVGMIILVTALIFFLCITVENGMNLTKDIFIPEIRIIEILKK